MLTIHDIRLELDEPESLLQSRAAQALHIDPPEITRLQIIKKALDARHKSDIHWIYGVQVSLRDEGKARLGGKVTQTGEREYAFPFNFTDKQDKPVLIVGAGPAGLFSALCLAQAGVRCVLIDRGKPVEQRHRDVNAFWHKGMLDPESNVQFGEGGAGTFSDGKLTTGIGDARLGFVLRTMQRHGAPEDILYLSKPHVGTDRLRVVVKSLREELLKLGCEIRYETRLVSLTVRDGAVAGARLKKGSDELSLDADRIVLAPGHSARDTFAMLYDLGVPMAQKNFAVGVRIEHRQELFDRAQYGRLAGHSALPVSSYKLSVHLSGGRSVFSFCVCPGGSVVAAASEPGRLVTNGMSEYARDRENINGALLVGVGPADYGDTHPLAGVQYQRKLENDAFILGGGHWHAPAQRVEDFLKHRKSRRFGDVRPSYLPGVTPADLSGCLPEALCGAVREALPLFDRRISGFALPDAVLTGVESRSSSPVRILRGEDGQSPLTGLFPCGEGAGYAGGIMSSAVDGIRAAEAVCRSLGLSKR